jgi:hypothetical protein
MDARAGGSRQRMDATMNRLHRMITWAAAALLNAGSMAAASQEEFFRALGGQARDGGAASPGGADPTRLLAFAGMALAGLILIAWIVQARKAAAGRAVHHPGKLQRELTKKVGIRPAQLKKLKALADEADVSSPLVLLLCPSLMAEALKKNRK